MSGFMTFPLFYYSQNFMKLLPHGTQYSGRPKSVFPVHGHLNLLPDYFVWIFAFHTLMINSGFKGKAKLLCPTLSSPMFKSPHNQKGLLKDALGQVSWATTSLQWAITI